MNQKIFNRLNNLSGRYFWLDMFFIFLAQYLVFFYLILLLIVLIYFPLTLGRELLWREVLLVFGSGAIGWLAAFLIKGLCFTPRPCAQKKTKTLLKKHEKNSAFPSAHTALFFSLGAALMCFMPLLGVISFATGILVGTARVIVGIHWPIDILGGAVLGISAGFILFTLYI